MYAVIRTGGKQYRVQPGDVLVVEKLDAEVGAAVTFEEVLMVGDGEGAVTVGAPLVDGASVTATLIETRKGEKIKVFKKIRRQGYRRTKGHRQPESVLRVTAMAGAGAEAAWEGEVDLTPRAELVARARGLAPRVTAEAAPAAPAEAQPEAKAPAAAKAESQAVAPKKGAAKPAAESAEPKAAAKPRKAAAKPAVEGDDDPTTETPKAASAKAKAAQGDDA